MFIFRGAYHWWPKQVAFRNDYCVTCRAQRRSVAVRSFDVGHFFWIPLLPVGFWRHWRCTECGRHPHRTSRFWRRLRWRGMSLLVVLSVMFWAAPINSDFALGLWVCRIAAPVGAGILLIRTLRQLFQPSLRTRLRSIPPAEDTICPFCQTTLVTGTGSRWSCPACGVVRC